jgi:uncharacterized repeat protein (TIGR03803 family)
LASAAVAKLLIFLLASGLAVPEAQAGVHYQRLKSLGSPDLVVNSRAQVIQASDGALYGMTTSANFQPSLVTVFRLNKDGSGYSVLYTFGNAGGDGSGPRGALAQGSDGVLYGTTTATSGGSNFGIGTVFKLNKNGTGYSILHSFGITGGDGVWPTAGLVEGTDGALYGTTDTGGSNRAGTVFKLNKDGSGYSVLHTFGNADDDGDGPWGGLVQGSGGALYGTTSSGGTGTNSPWCCGGTVFKLNKDGSGYSVLYSFGVTAADGISPGRLVEGSEGALYGSTAYGGSNDAGTVFKLNKDGSGYSVLYTFGNAGGDGSSPRAGLTQGSDGAFYSTTLFGGDFGSGTVFKIWPPETPDMIGVMFVTNTVRVNFAGVSGYHYQVLRSTDLTNWSVLAKMTMPTGGVYTNVDNAPPSSAAYYRAAWTP